MILLKTAIVTAYLLTVGLLALYGGHRSYLLRLYGRHRARARRPRPLSGARRDPLPMVTVQLPVYNERYVVERLIRAVSALEYPADRLEIQVLDDSTDDTSRRITETIASLQNQGRAIRHLRRTHRDGFKAGALADGLLTARGDLIAIFDADFVPGPRFLLDLVPHFDHPRVGMVQARWGHLNRGYSLLTRVQSILLDGHFVIEHAARHAAGRLFNFNGTAGIWRRACIESAGGWQSDTLTEDLDLSYRAQLAGWRFVFAPEVVAPAELPADINAFKSQQHRWARGSIETGRKILPRLLRSRLPLAVKIEAFFHLTANGAYLLMLLLGLLIVPATLIRESPEWRPLLLLDTPLVALSTLSVLAFYIRSQREIGEGWAETLASLPLLMSLGIGLCLNNTRAVCAGLGTRRAEFERTPKHSLEGTAGDWRGKRYRGRRRLAWLAAEALLGIYFTAAFVHALRAGTYASLPLL
ncbi:MAG TPA: cellulose synthase family protein, partial [Candidatus Polarisedimenticolia bacterium]|nr:cellulose synthase family protein [Candidatus Polarisedimenticolia bacterium]